MIRKAATDDIPAIRQMADVAFRDTYKDILSNEQMEYMMDWMYSESSLLLQMTQKGHIFFIEEGKGYVSFRKEAGADEKTSVYHIEKLYVLPQFQGQGLGRKLFGTVVKNVKSFSFGPIRIELNVNRENRAVSFYEHLGMHKDREGDFPIGKGFYMNDYIMAIELPHNILDISTRAELYEWFQDNHGVAREFWIRVNRSTKPCEGVIGYADAVEVALCFGWIDSTLKRIDSGKPFQRFSPRRKRSNWCAGNIERCRRLIGQGEMTEYGLADIPEELL